ncbi:MAG: hypothetical protein GF307_08370 [candidate division Zixibacteria bacterium]|nr:hypothetical protein [candidate division Zixibacteria bacterium]
MRTYAGHDVLGRRAGMTNNPAHEDIRRARVKGKSTKNLCPAGLLTCRE